MIKKDLDNSIYLLNEDDLDILFDLEEEYYRTGNFQRIFPPNEMSKHKY